jgi:hypothetical protein
VTAYLGSNCSSFLGGVGAGAEESPAILGVGLGSSRLEEPVGSAQMSGEVISSYGVIEPTCSG